MNTKKWTPLCQALLAEVNPPGELGGVFGAMVAVVSIGGLVRFPFPLPFSFPLPLSPIFTHFSRSISQ